MLIVQLPKQLIYLLNNLKVNKLILDRHKNVRLVYNFLYKPERIETMEYFLKVSSNWIWIPEKQIPFEGRGRQS